VAENSKYPRVLLVALGRINAVDSYNNGLLLRNLFADWPREHLAQIYSSGDTGDAGFFEYYYKLSPQDRRLGRLFYRLKAETSQDVADDKQAPRAVRTSTSSIRRWAKRLLVDTGLYEMVFAPRLSAQMLAWVRGFRPDVILAQGYNLTFARLPVQLRTATHARLAFFCSDDWPTYLYSGLLGEPRFLRLLVAPAVKKAASRLLTATDVPLAFGQPMAEEYAARYGKVFTVLSHTDDPRRFEQAEPVRVHPAGTFTLMAIGTFNRFRWPLLLDANESCRLLNEEGIRVRVAVLSSAIEPRGADQLAQASYIDLLDDPGHELLPRYLKGADVLLLAEAFDDGFVSAIRLSISSKAHLFMFSRRPVIVYAHSDTGTAKYAATHRWARVVSQRNVRALAGAIRDLLTRDNEVQALACQAYQTAQTFHGRDANQARLLSALTGLMTATSRPSPSPSTTLAAR
jgi:glycosyltransferase involved in cell wall biosynthesis